MRIAVSGVLSCAFSLVVLIGSGVSFAADHQWVMQGTVTGRSGVDALCLPSAAGSTYRMDFTFDDTAVGVPQSDPSVVRYASIKSWKLRIGSEPPAAFATGTAGGANGVVQVANDAFLGDSDPLFPPGVLLDSYETRTDGTTPASWTNCSDSGPDTVARFILADNTTTIFTSTAQPTMPFDPTGLFFPLAQIVLEDQDTVFDLLITSFVVAGSSQDVPVLPQSLQILLNGQSQWTFGNGCQSAPSILFCWYDPPLTDGYEYAAQGGALFTSIDDFPIGLGGSFEVVVGGSSIGHFDPGDSVDFSLYPGGGVDTFVVRGIDPAVDSMDDLAFPLALTLDTVPAQFTMTSLAPVNLPSMTRPSLVLLAASIMLLAGMGLRRQSARA